MRLRHGRLGPVEDVLHELLAVWQLDLLAVDDTASLSGRRGRGYCRSGRFVMSMFLRISMKPSVPRIVSRPSPQVARPSGVNQSTRMYPAPRSPRTRHVAEVLEPGVLRIVDVPDLRGRPPRPRRAGEEQELVGLVRRDVAEDAAIARALEEPRGTRLEVHPMRSRGRSSAPPGRWHRRCTSSPALTVARFSSRSLYMIE